MCVRVRVDGWQGEVTDQAGLPGRLGSRSKGETIGILYYLQNARGTA